MIHLVENKKSIAPIFDGWEETMIWSCLQGCMGVAYADDPVSPVSAQISVGDFCCFAGRVNEELINGKLESIGSNFTILAPQNKEWERAIEHCGKGRVKRHIRYSTKKEEDSFCTEKLTDIVSKLPEQYELVPIKFEEYEKVMALEWAKDLCFNYASYEDYKKSGIGFVIVKDGEIVSGASSYTFYNDGIEIEIDTREDERRKGLALVCGAKLILECLILNLYPSWDAHTSESLALSEKLGYRFDKEYAVYIANFNNDK